MTLALRTLLLVTGIWWFNANLLAHTFVVCPSSQESSDEDLPFFWACGEEEDLQEKSSDGLFVVAASLPLCISALTHCHLYTPVVGDTNSLPCPLFCFFKHFLC